MAGEERDKGGGGHAESDEKRPAPNAFRAAVGEEHGESGDHEDGEAGVLNADVDVSAGGAEEEAEDPVEQVGLVGRGQQNILKEVRRTKFEGRSKDASR